MNLLDEQIPDSQRQRLGAWRIRVHQIGYDVGRKGMKDQEIIPFLHQQRRVTFFTLDFDFFQHDLCHARYCLVCMDVRKQEAAAYVRRVLRHPQFNSVAKRMGKVIRASSKGIQVLNVNTEREIFVEWRD
ncbi:MAG TPA: hypothetical protein VFD70_07590 [Anaerolineae bacterium]|nr:hypothetical protein [Anaerolineae bacterium]